MPNLSNTLSSYIPQGAAPIIAKWIQDSGCQFHISKPRVTKLGDYRAPFKGGPHRISVNHDLNPYAFLVTTIHEFAHLRTWLQHKSCVKPHGEEWKNNFKDLIMPFLSLNIFPQDVLKAIIQYMNNPAASSCTDINLYQALRSYDKKSTNTLTIEALDENSHFYLKGGRIFQKGKKLRKRFLCTEISTGKEYLFSPIAEVYPIQIEPIQSNETERAS
ncbi:MAG: sprT domain-containing protein [Sphingobacterium sp.]|uniref:sprT domain-containing protein n=1 Tax=Sphingobacterium sp. JB170 TaxID=1434842 RepID=UPI00097EDD53|nr:sprT domain-containing protein [Sphingobacterium sp. JB170]SJN29185.1 hypothetical protein FM107_05860 [Sphingobacterium sp. JB170]